MQKIAQRLCMVCWHGPHLLDAGVETTGLKKNTAWVKTWNGVKQAQSKFKGQIKAACKPHQTGLQAACSSWA